MSNDITAILAALVSQAFERFTDNEYQPPNWELQQWLHTAEAALSQAKNQGFI